MKLYIDDVRTEKLKELIDLYPVDGVTSNPSVLMRGGRPPVEVLKELRCMIGPEKMLMAQVISTQAEDMIREAHRLMEILGADGENYFVKLPANPQGIKAIKALSAEGIRCNATGIYSVAQGLLAANAGALAMATYISRIDNLGGDGREKCEYYPEQIVYSTDNGKMARGLAKCIVDADYLINSALLKTHSGPGVTLTGKNWYGATDINLLWRQNAHNGVSQDKRNGKPAYKTFVDWMAHKNMGQKALLFIIDGTYGSRNVNGAPNPKWMKEPFNGQWACSLIMSQDEVACDAVGMDIIINEWPEFGSLNYCDEYLREAASIPNAPSGTVYKFGGKPLTEPLGLFEHWGSDHKYTKIDLIYKELK